MSKTTPQILTPLKFAQMASQGKYQTPRHLRLLQRFILKLLATPGRARGIVELPVRHGKSFFLSKYLPAWYLLTNPDHRVILTGYGGSFAQEWGRAARDHFATYAPHFGLRLDPTNRKANHWSISGHEGGMRTCGTLGPITGKGAHLLISDDQVKDQAAANSPAQRDRVFSWFEADALTRLEPDGKCIVVLSRRHPDDLVGRLLQTADDWQTLRLPALCDDPANDPLNRKEGEPLWPERWTQDRLLTIRQELELSGNSHVWECLYQQHPTGDPASREWPDDYFSGIWTPQIPTEKIRLRVLALDPSKGKHSTTGDYSAFVYMVLTTDGQLWVQSWLQRLPTDQLIAQAVSLLDQLKPDGFVYESTLFQELLGNMIAKECTSKSVPCPIWESNPKEDKVIRIRMALTPLLGQRRLHLAEDSPGNRLLLHQLRDFPTATHDDGPDALTMASDLINVLLNGRKATQNIVLKV